MRKTRKFDARPSLQFYPDDWLSETGLRMCSPSSRGIWIDLLCHMFKCEERGVLTSKSEKIGSKGVAALCNVSESEAQAAIDELLKYGVAERREDGALYNRRMYREWQKRQAKVEAGRKGGRASKKAAKPPSSSSTSSSSPTSSPTSREKETPPNPPKGGKSEGGKSKKFKPEDLLLPTHLRVPDVLEAWVGYLEVRKVKKYVMTVRAIKLVMGKLDDLTPGEALAALNEATEKGWKSIYPRDKARSETDHMGSMFE